MALNAVIGQDVTCGVFRRLPSDALEDGVIHRFVVGEDTALRKLSPEEARAELGDPFATLLLRAGTFPRTGSEVLDALRAAVDPDDPLARTTFFLVGEGGQLPFDAETAAVDRSLRFLATTGPGEEGPDVMISTGHPDSGDVELMAWDRASGGFNYYRTAGDSSAWVFAGNSRHALLEATEGKGPFESHKSGNLLMKELRFPWLHWHSFAANILPGVFAEGDSRRAHPWFVGKDAAGAATLEVSVAKPSIERWTRTRFTAITKDGEMTVERPSRIMLQILDTPTVNLITSHTESRAAPGEATVDLPQTFFVDSEALVEVLGLRAPPPFAVAGSIYAQSLATFNFRVSDGAGFERPGDTHFAFVVPERAFEDTVVVREAVRSGLLTERLAACLLMTDFPNPVFSARRARLLAHVPEHATVSGGQSDFSETMGDAIAQAAQATDADSPEREFAALWAAGDGWRDAANALLTEYHAGVQQQLTVQEGFDAYCRLAQSRREGVRAMPIFEFPLLFPVTNIPPAARSMRRDGTVSED